MITSNKKWIACGLLAVLALSSPLMADEIIIKPYQTGAERRLDNPVDAWMNAWSGPAGSAIKKPDGWRGDPKRYELLSEDAKNGDYSLSFTVADPAKESAFGFTSGKYILGWQVGPGASLHLWLKIAGAKGGEPVSVALYDTAGRQALMPLEPATGAEWREMDLTLAKFKAAEGFDFHALRSVQLEVTLPKGAQVLLDDIYFHQGESHLGVTDKTITQYMAETSATRPARTAEAIASEGARLKGVNLAFSAFWHGDAAEGNRLLHEYLMGDKVGVNQLPKFYSAFSATGSIRPNSLSPEVKDLLLAKMRPEDERINDIALTRHSTWNIVGSENLDYEKSFALYCSQIYRLEPKYADQVYPDPGNTLGFQGEDTYLDWIKVWQYAITPIGNYGDGKQYKPEEHYHAWVNYWKEYMAERARHGFFAEENANGAYGIIHVTNYHDMYTWAEDKELREQARMFLDLGFARSLQDQILLTQGGAMGRGIPGSGKNMIGLFTWCFLGGDGQYMTDLGLSDYQWPRVLWEMALDRMGRGEYAYVARKPNEARPLDPIPEGTEAVTLARPDSRIVHSSWVTPDYILGLRMDHPQALYQHCVLPAQGIVFPTPGNGTILLAKGPLYNLVQDRGVALVQHKRYAMVQHPPLFPSSNLAPDLNKPVQLTFGVGVDHMEEEGGWLFIQEGNAYGAFRIVSPGATDKPLGRDARGFGLYPLATDNYVIEKGTAGTTLTAKKSYEPLVIEMSGKAHHPTLADFKKDVLDNPLLLKSNNVNFGYLVSYKGCGPEAKELEINQINDQTPRIDGKYISYESPAFDSPWLKAAFGSGVITLTGPVSGEKLVHDFNERSPKEAAADLNPGGQ